MNKSFLYFLLLLLVGVVWQSCTTADDDAICDCREIFLSVNMMLSSPTDTVNLAFQANDGFNPTISGDTLLANTTYNFSTAFFDSSESPFVDVSDDIREEGRDHFIQYTSGTLNLTIALSDKDGDGNPIGLSGTLKTSDVNTGQLRVVLLHEPTKTAAGATGGEMDVDVSFPIVVE